MWKWPVVLVLVLMLNRYGFTLNMLGFSIVAVSVVQIVRRSWA